MQSNYKLLTKLTFDQLFREYVIPEMPTWQPTNAFGRNRSNFATLYGKYILSFDRGRLYVSNHMSNINVVPKTY